MNQHTLGKRIRDSVIVRSVHHGLELAIPFLIIGSFAVLVKNFPIPAYQNFITNFLNGSFVTFLVTLYNVSLGSLSLILCLTISLSYGNITQTEESFLYPLVAFISYLVFCGDTWTQEQYIFGAQWVFTMMCITLLACTLFRFISQRNLTSKKLYAIGASYHFNLAMKNLLPVFLIISFFAVIGHILRSTFGDSNITNFGSYFLVRLFDHLGGNLPSALLYVLISHGLWFLGIHGTNVLESVSQGLFESGIEINQQLIAASQAPTEIFSKTFLDIFVFIGGCGSILCLAIALLITAKRKHNRQLSILSLPFAMFNISEVLVFGFPVIINPAMLIPFILTPFVLTLTSTFAMTTGLVPLVTESVGWTVPIIFSGYQATGSIAGSILQVINLAIGVCIYIPFIRLSEKQQAAEYQTAAKQITTDVLKGEETENVPLLLHNTYAYNYYAKTLAADFQAAIQQNTLTLYYQPQMTETNKMHGIEALLRWNHPVIGFIPPPVIIELAQELNMMSTLTYHLMERAYEDAKQLEPHLSDPLSLSINISPQDLDDDAFTDKVTNIFYDNPLDKVRLTLELTERTLVSNSEQMNGKFDILHKLHIEFSIDDFGMGHSSVVRLQENSIDEVKLDGSLVTQLTNNERSREIIAGIVALSKNLDYRIVAEFVETAEQQKMLEDLGCTIYQGYYYSRPLNLKDLIEYVHNLR